jgi:hypothetical protein
MKFEQVSYSKSIFPDRRSKIMRKNGSSDNFSNPENFEVSFEQIIPAISGRPERSTTINQDDCINLQIALYTCKTMEEFLLLI